MEQIKDKEIEALEIEVKNKLCEFYEIIKQEHDIREEIKDHRKKLSQLYGKIYEKYTGKKVKVRTSTSFLSSKPNEIVGFFKGFSFYSYYDATYTVFPSIVLKKVKKDGTESVYEYPLSKVPSVKDIESIEIIE